MYIGYGGVGFMVKESVYKYFKWKGLMVMIMVDNLIYIKIGIFLVTLSSLKWFILIFNVLNHLFVF